MGRLGYFVFGFLFCMLFAALYEKVEGAFQSHVVETQEKACFRYGAAECCYQIGEDATLDDTGHAD